jgi:hypothetical protein
VTTSRRSLRAQGRIEQSACGRSVLRSIEIRHARSRSALRAPDRIAGGGEDESGKRRHRMSPVGQERALHIGFRFSDEAAIRRNWHPVHPSHLGPGAQVRIRKAMPGFRPKSSASTSHPVPKAVVG